MELPYFKDKNILADKPEDAPWWIIARLQGTTLTGGTNNHYFKLCIKSGLAQSEYLKVKREADESMLELYSSYRLDVSEYEARIMDYEATVGDFVDIGESIDEKYTQTAENATGCFSVKKINRAIKTYWEELGLD